MSSSYIVQLKKSYVFFKPLISKYLRVKSKSIIERERVVRDRVYIQTGLKESTSNTLRDDLNNNSHVLLVKVM